MFTNPGTRSHLGTDGQLKINRQFYVGANIAVNTSVLLLGNSSASIIANTLSIQVANSTANVLITPTSISLANSTANVNFTLVACFYGNSIANSTGNSTFEIIANSTGQTVITATTFSLGNSIANSQGNSTADWVVNSTANTIIGPGTVKLQGAGSNTGLTLGTSSVAANGYTWLPNGLLFQWGNNPAVNSTGVSVSFPIAFPTACFCVTAVASNVTVSANSGARNIPLVNSITTSSFTLYSGNGTSETCYWMATGH